MKLLDFLYEDTALILSCILVATLGGLYALGTISFDAFLLAGFSFLAVLFGIAYRRLRAAGLPDVDEEEFMERYYEEYSGNSEAVLQARKQIASYLGLPESILSPEQRQEDLVKRFDVLGDFRLGWSDLQEEATENLAPKGTVPTEELSFETVGALVEALAAGQPTRGSDI